MAATSPTYSLDNPLAAPPQSERRDPTHPSAQFYEDSLEIGRELLERPREGGGLARVRRIVRRARVPSGTPPPPWRPGDSLF